MFEPRHNVLSNVSCGHSLCRGSNIQRESNRSVLRANILSNIMSSWGVVKCSMRSFLQGQDGARDQGQMDSLFRERVGWTTCSMTRKLPAHCAKSMHSAQLFVKCFPRLIDLRRLAIRTIRYANVLRRTNTVVIAFFARCNGTFFSL